MVGPKGPRINYHPGFGIVEQKLPPLRGGRLPDDFHQTTTISRVNSWGLAENLVWPSSNNQTAVCEVVKEDMATSAQRVIQKKKKRKRKSREMRKERTGLKRLDDKGNEAIFIPGCNNHLLNNNNSLNYSTMALFTQQWTPMNLNKAQVGLKSQWIWNTTFTQQ